MKRSNVTLLIIFAVVVIVPQLFMIATSDAIEAVAGRMAFVVIPLLVGSLWVIGWVGNTIERIIKGRE